jgi:hypothetical protein
MGADIPQSGEKPPSRFCWKNGLFPGKTRARYVIRRQCAARHAGAAPIIFALFAHAAVMFAPCLHFIRRRTADFSSQPV